MADFSDLIIFVDTKIKNNIKDNDYNELVKLIQKIYFNYKFIECEQEEYNDVYGSY